MDAVLEDNHANVRKDMVFSAEPFAFAIQDILELNPDCYMSSIYDVLVERFVETNQVESVPGNNQTLRNYMRHLRESGKIGFREESRRKYDVIETPPPGKKAQVDFGQ